MSGPNGADVLAPVPPLGRASAARIVRNFSWLAVGQVVYRLIFLALVVVLARTLSVEDYALVTLLLVYTTIWVPVFNFGLGIIGVREMAQGSIGAADFVGHVLPLKVAVSVIGVGFMVAVGATLGYTERLPVVLFLLSGAAVVVSVAEFFHLPFTAREEMRATALLVVCERLAVAVGGGAAVVLGLGALGFAAAYLLGSVIGLSVAIVVWSRRFGRATLTWDIHLIRWYVRESWPVALTWVFAMAYSRVGLVVLDQVRGDAEVASLNTAFFVLVSLQQGIMVLVQAMFPALSQAHKWSREVLRGRLRLAMVAAFPALILLVVLLVELARLLVPVLFGPQFAQVPALLGVIVWVLPLFALTSLLGSFLQASGRQGMFAWVMGAGLVVSGVLSVPLAVSYGAAGVAFGMVLSEGAILTTLVALLARREADLVEGKVWRGLVLATGAVGLAVASGLGLLDRIVAYVVVVAAVGWLLVVRGSGREVVVGTVRGMLRR